MRNTFGNLFTLTTFGESHGEGIGGVVDGMPPGIGIDLEGKSTGSPIGFIVRNTDQHSKDYDNMRNAFRPSHADFTYLNKYGLRDYRGGGRSSARITISRCVGGALAKLALRPLNIDIRAYTSQVGDIALDRDYRLYDLNKIETNAVRCPDAETAHRMEELITEVKAAGDTIGGVITCVVRGCPVGLGEPEFGKLHAQIGAAMPPLMFYNRLLVSGFYAN